jgi:predicted acetyltransferase
MPLLSLIKPDLKYEKSFLEALDEFKLEGIIRGFWYHNVNPYEVLDYVKLMQHREVGIDLPPNWVPNTTYWLVEGDEFIGHINIRHYLT